jgi:hypothetical protein
MPYLPRIQTRLTLLSCCLAVLILLAHPAAAQFCWPEAWTDATERVSVLTIPDGSGDALDYAQTLGGGRMDATVWVQVFNTMTCDPLPGFPAADMWLETTDGGVHFCPLRNIADGPTDEYGFASFSHPLGGGGQSDPQSERLAVYVSGIPANSPAMDIQINSPDINGDFVVNISDLAMFVSDYVGTYHYRSDFSWDYVLNLSDVVYMSSSFLATCQ